MKLQQCILNFEVLKSWHYKSSTKCLLRDVARAIFARFASNGNIWKKKK